MKEFLRNKTWIGFGVVVLFFFILYLFLLRHWALSWGATSSEETMALPGDDRVPRARMLVTRAITLPAPPEKVWPWLVQIGTKRAGWYSYDWLDNGGRPSAREILPPFQHLKIGDNIPASGDGSFGFPVVMLEKNRVLGLGGMLDFQKSTSFRAEDPQPRKYMNALWVMVLQPLGKDQTRFLVRYRMDYQPAFPGCLAQAFLEPVHFIMERKMLLELQKRVSAVK